MDLYSVEHGASLDLYGLEVDKMPVSPSPELLANLEKLPKGSRVGLEIISKEHAFSEPFLMDGEEVTFDSSDMHYWRVLFMHCDFLGHKVVFLDSQELHEEIFRKKVARNLLIREAMQMGEASFTDQKLVESIELLDAEMNYAFKVLREDFIIAQIANADLDAAVIGRAHGEYLMFMQGQPSDGNIRVGAYYTGVNEATEVPLATLLLGSQNPIKQKLEPGRLGDNQLLKERKRTERLYRAHTLGRILPDSVPAFIGTWSMECRPEGLFEIYPGVGGVSGGTIEDPLGQASYEGAIDDKYIDFTKVYDPENAVGPVIDGPIRYVGIREGLKYIGEWRADGASGQFVLHVGDSFPGITKPRQLVLEVV